MDTFSSDSQFILQTVGVSQDKYWSMQRVSWWIYCVHRLSKTHSTGNNSSSASSLLAHYYSQLGKYTYMVSCHCFKFFICRWPASSKVVFNLQVWFSAIWLQLWWLSSTASKCPRRKVIHTISCIYSGFHRKSKERNKSHTYLNFNRRELFQFELLSLRVIKCKISASAIFILLGVIPG